MLDKFKRSNFTISFFLNKTITITFPAILLEACFIFSLSIATAVAHLWSTVQCSKAVQSQLGIYVVGEQVTLGWSLSSNPCNLSHFRVLGKRSEQNRFALLASKVSFIWQVKATRNPWKFVPYHFANNKMSSEKHLSQILRLEGIFGNCYQ